MDRKKVFPILLAGVLGITAIPVYADTQTSDGTLSREAQEKSEALKNAKIELQKSKLRRIEQQEAMQSRLNYVAEDGEDSWTQILQNSGNISELISCAEYISKMAELDKEMLEDYESDEARMEKKYQQVQEEYDELISPSVETQTTQSQVSSSSAEMNALLSQVQTTQAEQSIGYETTTTQAEAYEVQASESEDYGMQVYSQETAEPEPYNDATYSEAESTDATIYPWNFNPEEDTMANYSSAVATDVVTEYLYGEEASYNYYGATAATYEEPTYEEASYEELTYEEVSYEEPTYEEVSYEEPTYEEVSYEEPTYEEVSYEEPTYEEMSYEESTYEEMSYEEPTYEEISYEEPTYEETNSADTASDSGQGTYLGTFTLTAYCGCASCCGAAGQPTASGTMPVQGRTVAMGDVPFGTQLLINGYVYTVEDRGTPYGHVDIYFDSHEEALAFGCQSAEVYQLN